MQCRRIILKILWTLMEKENCRMHGQVSRDSLYWIRSHLMDKHGPGRRLTRKETTSRPDSVWPDMWKDMSEASSHFYLHRQITLAPPPTEESCSLAIYHPLTGYEPNVLDDFHYSQTSAMIFQDESGYKDTEPSYLCDAEFDDETIGKALSSPLFIHEREEPTDRRQAYHSHEESLLLSQSFFAHTRTERPVHELGSCQKTKTK